MNSIQNEFYKFSRQNSYTIVERSNLVSKYFKNEFNLSGAHGYLVPAVRSNNKIDKTNISVIDPCIRKTDTEIIGVSKSHLLLFEMGVWGCFGYIEDKFNEEYCQLSNLLLFLSNCGIDKDELIVTLCGGGKYLDKEISFDMVSYQILLELGIKKQNIIHTFGRRNFMLSRGIDRLAGYNIEFFVRKNNSFLEIASSNIYRFINKLTYLQETFNSGIGCGIGFERIRYALTDVDSIYELAPFDIFKEAFEEKINSKISIELINDKVFRIIEIAKTLIMILNDNQEFDNSSYGKIMRGYIVKIASDLDFIRLDYKWFVDVLRDKFRYFFGERYLIKDGAFNQFEEALLKRLNRLL